MENTMLIGVAVSLLAIIARKIVAKFGVEASRIVILVALFVVSVVIAIFTKVVPEPVWQEGLTILATAVGFYEVVVKTIAMPVLNKVTNKKV